MSANEDTTATGTNATSDAFFAIVNKSDYEQSSSRNLSSYQPATLKTMKSVAWVKNHNPLNLNSVYSNKESPNHVLNETLPGRPLNWQTDSGPNATTGPVKTKEGSGVPGHV